MTPDRVRRVAAHLVFAASGAAGGAGLAVSGGAAGLLSSLLQPTSIKGAPTIQRPNARRVRTFVMVLSSIGRGEFRAHL